MYGPTNGLKGIIGLIALAYFGYLVAKVAMIYYSSGSLDVENSVAYGVSILAFGGMVYASFAINAYRFSGTPVYYLIAIVLMAQIGWYGYSEAMTVSTDMSMLAADQAAAPPKPVPVSSSPPAQSPPAVVTATPPTPPKLVDNSPWPKDRPSGSVMITPAVTTYLNTDHIHNAKQPTPVPNMAAAKDTTNSATATP